MVRTGAGDRIAGRYLLQEPIGRGGMGIVWRAHDELLDRRVAVKCARPDDERAAQRLKKEARNAARLHHPNIVAVFDFVEGGSVEGGSGEGRFGEGYDVCWIVMEYVPGASLAELVRERGPLSPEEAASIGCQIAAALATSHAEGVVHGDVTPENILVTGDGVAKLTDFGISRALWSEVTITMTGGVQGKPPYLPPEVARGGTADRKSDIFSLGASLFAAVEGRSPYGEAAHPMAYVARAIDGSIATPHRAGPLGEPLAALLEVEPGQRPAATKALRLLRQAATPTAAAPTAAVPPAEPHALNRTFRTLRTLRLLPPPAGGRARRRPGRGVVITATALVTVAALATGLALFGPWSGGSSDDSRDSPGGRGTGDAKPSAARRAGTIGDARTADPCALLDAASLSRFGETELDPDYGELDRCDVLLHGDSGDDVADVQINFDADPAEPGDERPARRIGNVTVMTSPRDGDICERTLALADRKQIRVIAKRLGSPAPDPCALGDAATDHAVAVLDRGQVPRRTSAPNARSLARVNACELLDATALRRLPGVGARPSDPGFGNWRCEWEDGSGDTGVELEFDRSSTFDTDDGQPTVLAGRKTTVTPADFGDDSCVVRTLHRSYRNALGDPTVELMTLNAYGPQPPRKLCRTAKALAATAAKKLPTP
ncbi:serine/threonine-protein kinase [Streptomyces sp. NPDC005962]|uniref:serine/threonine-protein kinase n=1 Tax=Streptomyces sp. NPDC005962 TaxID=3154466 RepID=UPI0033CBC1ED